MNREILSTASPVLKEFIMYLETVKGKSEKTVSEYFLDLRMFFRFLKMDRKLVDSQIAFDSIPIDDVDIPFLASVQLMDVYAFLNYLKSERHDNASTRARKTSSIRQFFGYISVKQHYLKENPVVALDTPKAKKSLPKYLTLEQSLELLSKVEGENKERDYCILTIFLNCGLRLSELVGINLHDIRSDNTLRVVGKGNKERILYLNPACLDAIQRYLKVRPVDGVKDKDALFISRLKQRMGVRAVQLIVEKYFKAIGLDGQGYSTHKLRHTAATLMYQHGNVDIRVLKDILGHENLGTTQIYTHISDKQMENAVNANPLSNVHPKSKKEPE